MKHINIYVGGKLTRVSVSDGMLEASFRNKQLSGQIG